MLYVHPLLVNVLVNKFLQRWIPVLGYATFEEAVFSVDLTNTPMDWLDSDHMTCVSCDACLFLGYIRKTVASYEE
jgi:hypothetical protein